MQMLPENQKKQVFQIAHKSVPSWQMLSAIVHDIFATLIAWTLAYLLRFNFKIPPEIVSSIWQLALLAIPLQLIVFIKYGLYRGVWRFASIPDLMRILMAVATTSIIIIAFLFMLKPIGITAPRAVLVMYPLLLILLMGGSRLVYRYWKEYKLYGVNGRLGTPVLILGAGEAAIALLKDLARSEEWRVIGLLDDDDALFGRELLGVKVLGKIAQLAEIVTKLEVEHVIIAMPSASHQSRRKALETAKQCELTVLTIPAFEDLMSGKVSISQVRHIEVEDLLGRAPVMLDDKGLHGLIESQVVFVSGAGGSIGSELCRQILKFNPKCLVCFDISEFALYQLEQELLQSAHTAKLIFVTGDVKNAQRVTQLLAIYKPFVVFHAAAYKHVPLMETHNVAQALANNVLGTYVLANACKLAAVNKFVLISTDKAVNPTNVMGASKRLAEMVCQSLEGGDQSKTHFVMVRFGNVLGSSGSVIPKFREQIASGGPVTVTHPEITRYFMSIPEAAQLVMQAGLMGVGGEIFVLDMGEPVKIAELAKDMIRLSGFHHDEVKINYTGLRPGEKLYEELLADDEQTQPTPHPKLRIAMARKVDLAWVETLLKWVESCQTEDELVIKKQLATWVEEYVENPAMLPISNVVPLRKTKY